MSFGSALRIPSTSFQTVKESASSIAANIAPVKSEPSRPSDVEFTSWSAPMNP